MLQNWDLIFCHITLQYLFLVGTRLVRKDSRVSIKYSDIHGNIYIGVQHLNLLYYNVSMFQLITTVLYFQNFPTYHKYSTNRDKYSFFHRFMELYNCHHGIQTL